MTLTKLIIGNTLAKAIMKIIDSTTLLDYLFRLYPDSSRTKVKQILGSGTISVNGQATTAFNLALNPGDVVEIASSIKHQKIPSPYPILLEDENFVVIEKPVGIVTSSEQLIPSVFKALSHWYREKSHGREKVWVVHRLDKEVSGVLLFARKENMVEILRSHWDDTQKIYTALVEGRPPQAVGEIHSWLLEDSMMKVASVPEGTKDAKEAITLYRTLKEINACTLVEIELKTGRKNQIRVHLSELGCPIVGDRKHGADAKWDRRVRLHASRLTFPHPITRHSITIESKLPSDFLVVKNANEHYK